MPTRSLSIFGAVCALWLAAMLTLPTPSAVAQDQTDPPTLESLGAAKRPQTGEDVENGIRIDFEDAPLIDLIRAIGLHTGKNFDVTPQVQNQQVTIISYQPVPADLALELLEGILANRQLQMIETLDGNLIRIVPQNAQQGADKTPPTIGDSPVIEGYDRLATHIIQLQYADSSEIGDLLGRVGSVQAEITAYPEANLLILRDTADGIRNMLTLIDVLDQPGTGTSVEIFALDWARAETLAQQISEVLIGDEGAAAPGQAPRPAVVRRQPRAAQVPGQPTSEVVGGGEPVLRIVPDERLNTLIVVASEGMMEQVRFLVQQLDTANDPDTNNIHVIDLLNADAEEVASALDSIIGTAAPRAAGQGGQGGEVQPFERDVVVTSYTQTNSLLLLATPQDFQLISDIIARLDVPRRQVSIEAVVMQVTIDDTFSLSVESALLDSDDAFALSNTVSIANVLTGGITSFAGPGATIGLLDGTVDITGPDGGTITVPNVPFLVRALETITDVEVLSRPNLLVVDNEDAELNVGDEVPIVTTQSDVSDTTGFLSRGRVERRDTGVILRINPRVQEGDYVQIDAYVEVSQPSGSDVGIDPNETGVTIAKSVVESNVVIGDGQTGIIGGLISESLTRGRSQVPFLGDLPLIGLLFRGKSSTRAKQNLVVLLTPHIVKRSTDLERVTRGRLDSFYGSNVDAIFEKGFVKKIKGKRNQRKTGPVVRTQNSGEFSTNFNRGRLDDE